MIIFPNDFNNDKMYMYDFGWMNSGSKRQLTVTIDYSSLPIPIFLMHSGGRGTLVLWLPYYTKYKVIGDPLDNINITINILSNKVMNIECYGAYTFGSVYAANRVITIQRI